MPRRRTPPPGEGRPSHGDAWDEERARRLAGAILHKVGDNIASTYAMFELGQTGALTREELEAFCADPPYGEELVEAVRAWGDFDPKKPFDEEFKRYLIHAARRAH